MAVELRLALALPTSVMTNPILFKGSMFDLNTTSSYSDDDQSNASIGFCGSSISIHSSGDWTKKKMKRSLDEASESDSASTDANKRTLPLLKWNKKPKDDDDLPNGDRTCNLTLIRNGVETEGLVGWPPIKTHRKKQREQNRAAARNGGRHGGGRSNCLYVKVQIEGFLITRKVDLNVHRSYDTLTSALLFMFGRGYESVEEYNLTYQDKEGDWLLAADLPWRTFIQSVHRLKLTKKEY